MERLLQYLDDMDDFVYALALTWERVRSLCNLLLSVVLMSAALALGFYGALTSPPLAVAGASLLAVALLYWGVVERSPIAQSAA